jgi:putative ABC transport system permease protein
MRRLFALYRNIFRKGRANRELEEELRSYVELVASEKVRCGADREEVLQQAHWDLAQLEPIKESVLDIRTGASMDILLQDLRYGIRTLARNPSFSVIAVLTLALAIGANTTMFTIVNSVLLRPLPYPEPDRLVMLWEKQLTDNSLGTVSPANFYDWREQTHSFAKMAALDPYPDFILNGYGEPPQRLKGAAVSADFFSLFGIRMALGRDFLSKEDRPNQNQVVVVSYLTWQRHFGGRADIIGKQLNLNNIGYIVIGVLPRDFSFVSKPTDFQARNRIDLWTPLALPSPPEPWQRGTHPLGVFARLKPGIGIGQAQADLDRIAGNLERLYPDADKGRGIAAVPLKQHVVANVRPALLALLTAVGLVLLIACANIGNLLLTRAAARQHEMSLRTALGASGRRLARQLCTESMVLVLLGGLLGLVFAVVAVPVIVRYLPADLPRASEIAVDGPVLAFTSIVSLLTGIAFGFVPLLQTRRVETSASLKKNGRGVTGAHSYLRSTLIVGQVAIALVLLVGAGLMTKSLWRLLQVSPGFETDHILTARLSLPPQYLNGYKFGTGQHRRISAFQRELLEHVRNISGVQSAAFTAYLPLSGADNSWNFEIEGRPPNPPGVNDVMNYRPVSADFFNTLGIPIQRGRSFQGADNEDAPLVVIVNESMARAFWPHKNPLGQRLRFSENKWRTIVGIVADVHHETLAAKPEPEMYLPYAQAPNVEARPTIVVRTSAEPTALIKALRKAISEVDSNVPVDQIETMQQIVSASVSQSRFRTAVLFVFALLALSVAGIGLYGVMSYLVGQRMPEFGVRMAVGASSGAVLRLVLGNAARLVGIGIGIGLVSAALLGRLISSLLYGVEPFDAATLTGASVFLAVVAFLASYIPAHRAAKADPMQCLRYE